MPDILCLIGQVLIFYTYVLFARIILSFATQFWAPPSGLAPVIRILYDLTEPVLGFARRYIPPIGMFDLSPIVVFIVIRFLVQLLCS